MNRQNTSRALLGLLIAAYLVIGTLYAAFTPTWQVPDEPAHYNYIRALAEGRGFPVIESEDYDQEYLSRLTSEKFPETLPVDAVAYEDHQPPLYYLLAMPIYWLFGGAVLPLRLFSVALGAVLLLIVHEAVQTIFPARADLPLIATAFVAFIPQHVAMSAGINNDVLGELVLAGTLWALLAYVDGSTERPWTIGLLLAAALLAKTTAYVAVGVAIVAVIIRWRREHPRHPVWAFGQLAWMAIPAMMLTAPWFLRNASIYGWQDPLGLGAHNAIVEEQPRTVTWLAEYGWAGLLRRMARTTFHSFWGQFGWMAVVLPRRIYQALAGLTLLLSLGLALWLARRPGERRELGHQLGLLALSAAFTLGAFLWYNLTFVQHQGRYLFPALIPLSTAAALSLTTLARPLPRTLRYVAFGALFAGMAALDIFCLFRCVIPFL